MWIGSGAKAAAAAAVVVVVATSGEDIIFCDVVRGFEKAWMQVHCMCITIIVAIMIAKCTTRITTGNVMLLIDQILD